MHNRTKRVIGSIPGGNSLMMPKNRMREALAVGLALATIAVASGACGPGETVTLLRPRRETRPRRSSADRCLAYSDRANE